jgi:hypothetical protein
VSKSSRRADNPGSQPTGQSEQPTTTHPSVRPARPGRTRAGRRERSRPLAEPSLFERYRILIVGGVIVAVVALLMVVAFSSAAQPAYACSVEFQPGTTPAPAPNASGEPGYVQDDMGNGHVPTGAEVTYTYCPPATGSHYNDPNRGPIAPRVYGPNDGAIPQGWVHNLEHGNLVVLYRGREGDPGLTNQTQEAIRTWAAGMPDSPVCGFPADQYLVAARFDEMATPFAALVWGRILPLQSFDTAAIENFWNTSGEQALTMPERGGCPVPDATPAASPDATQVPG